MKALTSTAGMQALAAALIASLAVTNGSALAADGILEINQACVATGCVEGDDAGFPVTLTQAGSYILTSNLDVRDETTPENVTAIEVSTSDNRAQVTIDLNGFRVVGPTVCLGNPPTSCSPTGTGTGIHSNNNMITVRNGRILGMGDDGIRLIAGVRVEDMHISSCGGDGIEVSGSVGLILDNAVHGNGGRGIVVAGATLVTGNVIQGNVGIGLQGPAKMAYGQNVIPDNAGGAVSGGVQIGVNLCGIALCP